MDDNSELDIMLDELLNYFIHVERQTLLLVERGIKDKSELMLAADAYLRTRGVSAESRKRLIDHFSRFIWGYYILEEAINDKDISDIKVLSENNVRIKRKGRRMNADIRFPSKSDYKRFISMVAVKNKTNLSDVNAIQSFTDKESNSNFILRFNIATDFVNSCDVPYLHIRKIPKKKYTIKNLIELNMLDEKTADYLINAASNSSGILFTGKGASGKTTLMNVLLDYIPHDKSGLVIQENEELFSNSHPDMMFQHIVSTHGEGKIQYDLKDLGRNGLLTDLDYFIIGEIKGGEALYLLNASYTGHRCWASVHGMSSTEAFNKLADYVKYESDYSLTDIKRMLIGIKTIVYMKDFKVCEISEVRGMENGEIVYEKILG
ncbi:MAG: ATPase, T2SS/T4P/T4SS family [Lachnospiraceae bacterium]|nr:Flp pilus assembly complex ATPase component TadA [Lachnoclostridium sp.]MDD7521376.1 ATPase, T2SS/T4P/T4SS family [Lachnoclostridium sp.]MDY2598825.1 ATPase, T2SS/T4P/T4SS family [Lachnospiraceae bacterium]